MGVDVACLSVCTPFMQYPHWPEEGFGPLGVEVGGCEPACGVLAIEPELRNTQAVLLTHQAFSPASLLF